MRIIFLDIDGVLNCHASWVALGGAPFPDRVLGVDNLSLIDPISLGLVQKLVKETDAQVVLSSSWRKRTNLVALATSLQLPIIDKTPELWCGEGMTRGMEIAKWLEVKGRDVESFVIIDDDCDMLDEQMPFFVKTDFADGFCFGHFMEAQKILLV